MVDVQDTIVVVPCYNEARRFDAPSFEAAAAADPSLAFLFVDDGSRDDTRALLSQLRDRRPEQLSLLGLDRNVGKAEAVRLGMQSVFDRAPRLVGYLDADLATPLGELAPMRALFAERGELQVVLGSRVGLLGRDVVRTHRRHYLGRIFASLGAPDNKSGMVVLTPEQQRSCTREHPESFVPVKGKWGEQGCTTVRLSAADEESVGEALTLARQNAVAKGPTRKPAKRRASKV